VALLAAMFLLPWFGPSAALERSFDEAHQIQSQFGGPDVVMPDVEDNAWEAFGFVRFVLLAAALCGIGLAVVRRTPQPRLTRLRTAALTTGLGIAATALVLYHLVNPPGDSSREIGVFAGLLASGGVALGGWLVLDREEQARRRRPTGAGVSAEAAPPGRARSATRTRSRSSSD
jgi:hypothetical protein